MQNNPGFGVLPWELPKRAAGNTFPDPGCFNMWSWGPRDTQICYRPPGETDTKDRPCVQRDKGRDRSRIMS